ncbi:helix-turn-helix domain-containing protein [Bradyrhizobium sp.]|uniref:helix-turn-helix domain-containing protein n=1 Tax=Bradyrhizobium sp. TaxID=376 RepID=UPI00273671AC|nr:helix-turn-helix domain-containing protein [Bradyrhizobium sp.]MDP3078659.1 helix-turn-helix domain-containing protein [Bradyrhizobium sp.]
MERPTFYAVIPAFVRYAPISAQAKLFYGEVTALCEKEGYCWASNGYFGQLYDADERTVRRWLKELVVAGFVTVDLACNQHGQRRIFLARTNLAGQICPDKNVLHNDTRVDIDTRKHTPPTPKGEPDGFEEIWKAKWSRGTAPNPRQPALKAYTAALKRGSSPADILAGVKARVGVEKEDTPYAPQLVTWLNQDRWKDGTGAAVMKSEDMAAAQRRIDEMRRQSERRAAMALAERRKQMGLSA